MSPDRTLAEVPEKVRPHQNLRIIVGRLSVLHLTRWIIEVKEIWG